MRLLLILATVVISCQAVSFFELVSEQWGAFKVILISLLLF